MMKSLSSPPTDPSYGLDLEDPHSSSGWMAKMQQRGRSHTPRPPQLPPVILALLAQLNQRLGLFVPSLDQSRDAQHLSYNDLPEQTQIDALYLRQIRQ